MASFNPTAAYRGQNGIPQTGGADPNVVTQIMQAAHQTGADPQALLATALQESGAQRGRVGDNGTSFGPFQFHQGGALAGHSPAWANSYQAILNRAQEFKRLGVHGGVGAAAVQRPLDRALYAQGVNSLLGKADSILDTREGQPGAPSAMPAPRSPGSQTLGQPSIGNLILQSIQPGVQSVLNSNAQIAGVSAPTLPVMPTPTTPTTPRTIPGAATTPTRYPSSRGIYQHGNWAGADQGVDYRGSGRVTALADAVVTRVDQKSSWIGAGGKGTGAIVSYRILSGPHAGRNVYVAENITPHVRVGQRVAAGQPIATAHGSFPYTESGWADANGSPIGALGTSNTGRAFAAAWGLA